jgi:hypothetical protein
MLWNILNNLEGVKVYSEPFAPEILQVSRNPTIKLIPPVRMKHFFVEEYTTEYKDLPPEEFRRLYTSCNGNIEKMFEYLTFLYNASREECTGIKTIRMWGNLDKLKEAFPEIKLIHLWRSLEPQWRSNKECGHGRDLCKEFKYGYSKTHPSLVELDDFNFFKAVWELCIQEATSIADISVKYEDILQHGAKALGDVFQILQIPDPHNTAHESMKLVRR